MGFDRGEEEERETSFIALLRYRNSKFEIACCSLQAMYACWFNKDNVMDPLRAWRST